ncbi:helix-turn-helix domain-containing protein [bacterium]|jgi:excisionase family DNA binding protein|nr:helix-turn-helix domain-containing protein [bacterium]MDA7633153.1 helix-turn-helix domain-containing protein [bacterium]MDB4745821.1 helix-turn-helix domain-containing protein [Verrucomicrobiota bacterium]MDB4798304.1 helix-turn-helix domain-containing protein [Verrucomicrobiota bacterium]
MINDTGFKEKTYLTKRQVADLLQLTPRTVDRLMTRGLPHYKIGNQRARFSQAEIRQWMEEECKTVRFQ